MGGGIEGAREQEGGETVGGRRWREGGWVV